MGFQKKCVLPGGILFFFSKKSACYLLGFCFFFQKIPDFENSSWIFFHLKKVLKFFGKIRRNIYIQTNYDRSFNKFGEHFFHKIPPILKLEVGFFSDKKSFSQIFENTEILFHLRVICKKKKIRETFSGAKPPD